MQIDFTVPIDAAINVLASRASEDKSKSHESMQFAQAALNLAQAKAILENIARNPSR